MVPFRTNLVSNVSTKFCIIRPPLFEALIFWLTLNDMKFSFINNYCICLVYTLEIVSGIKKVTIPSVIKHV